MSSKRTAKRIDYPMGSISSGTMRNEDLIPEFAYMLGNLAERKSSSVPLKTRRAHLKLVKAIESRMEGESYHDSKMTFAGMSGRESFADDDLEALTIALECYSAPYFYFGSHPGDGADFGFWLSESWDEEFYTVMKSTKIPRDQLAGIKVEDLSLVPSWFRGEVAVVNDHGNVTLYVKASRSLREIWSVV